jgi:hypothetical protein
MAATVRLIPVRRIPTVCKVTCSTIHLTDMDYVEVKKRVGIKKNMDRCR